MMAGATCLTDLIDPRASANPERGHEVVMLDVGDGRVEDAGDARCPGQSDPCGAVGERPAEAEVRPLSLGGAERQDLQ